MGDPGRRDRRRLIAFGLLPLLHAAMFAYDLGHPDRFLNADRASGRMRTIESFAEAWRGGDPSGVIAGYGVGGDWLPQAMLYLAGGRAAVIAVQVILALLSVYWVYGIGVRIGLGPATARAAALLYALLPHTLVYPHQLASEAIFDPLVVGSFALLARAAHAPGHALWGSGAVLGFATLVRPITLLWPIVTAAFVPGSRRARAAYLLAALIPLLGWMLFIQARTGEFSLGRSPNDMGHNLYSRAERIATAARIPDSGRPRGAAGDGTLSVREYFAFALAHPVPALAHSLRDVVVLITKSGVERILLDYLDVSPEDRIAIQTPTGGWRKQLERTGPWATLVATFARNPLLVLASALGALAFVGILLLAILGARAWLRAPRTAVPAPVRSLRILILAFPLYVLMTTQAVNSAQSRHRAPAEFALCLLAASGMAAWRRRPAPGPPPVRQVPFEKAG